MEQILYFVAASTPTAAHAVQRTLDATVRQSSPLLARSVRFVVETNVPRTLEQLRVARNNYGREVE